LNVALLCGAGRDAVADEQTDLARKAEVKLLELVNDARAAKGLGALIEHQGIVDEARAHSEFMASVGSVNHTGFAARTRRIANGDTGIDQTQICENTASARVRRPGAAAKGILAGWKRTDTLRDCMFDNLGYTTESAAVGAVLVEGVYWVTFMAAHDTTP
jgi:uncharacterized protein YkwD